MALPELVSAEELFKGGAWDQLIDFGLAAIFSEFPFLNIPILSHFIKWLIRRFTDALYKGLTEVINLKYVIVKNMGLQKQFTELALSLKGIALKNGLDSEEYKIARKEHQKALAAKVRSLLVPVADRMLQSASAKCQGMRDCGGSASWVGLRREQHWKNVANGLRAGNRVA